MKDAIRLLVRGLCLIVAISLVVAADAVKWQNGDTFPYFLGASFLITIMFKVNDAK